MYRKEPFLMVRETEKPVMCGKDGADGTIFPVNLVSPEFCPDNFAQIGRTFRMTFLACTLCFPRGMEGPFLITEGEYHFETQNGLGHSTAERGMK